MENNQKMTLSDKVFWAIFAFFALSSWSSYILTNILGLRSNIYELYFLPVVVFYHKQVLGTSIGDGIKLKISRGTLRYLLYVLFCFIVGLIVCAGREFLGDNLNYVIEHILAFRFVIYSSIIICIFSRSTTISLEQLLYISFFSVLGDFVAILTIHSTNYASTLNLIALSLLVIIPIVQNRMIVSLIAILFSVMVAIRSSYRISIVVVFVAVLFALLYSSVIRQRKRSFILLLVVAVAFFLLIQNFDVAIKTFADYFGMQHASYRRISYRLTEALHGGEIGRSRIYLDRLQLCFSEIIPFGLFRRAVGEYGWYTDTPFVFILDAFGFVGGVVILFSVIKKGIRVCYLSLKRHDLPYLGVLAIMFPVYVVLFIVNGTFLFWTYVACLSGIIIGYWFNSNIDALNWR